MKTTGRKVHYAQFDHPVHGPLWMCAFNDATRSLNGMGETPQEAYLNLISIENQMTRPWPAPQLQ